MGTLPDMSGTVPIYLSNEAVVGNAIITQNGHHIEIDISGELPIGELMSEHLIGFNIMYMGVTARDVMDEAAIKERENTHE